MIVIIEIIYPNEKNLLCGSDRAWKIEPHAGSIAFTVFRRVTLTPPHQVTHYNRHAFWIITSSVMKRCWSCFVHHLHIKMLVESSRCLDHFKSASSTPTVSKFPFRRASLLGGGSHLVHVPSCTKDLIKIFAWFTQALSHARWFNFVTSESRVRAKQIHFFLPPPYFACLPFLFSPSMCMVSLSCHFVLSVLYVTS